MIGDEEPAPAPAFRIREYTIPETSMPAHRLLFTIAEEDLGIPSQEAGEYLGSLGYRVRHFPEKFAEMLGKLQELAESRLAA